MEPEFTVDHLELIRRHRKFYEQLDRGRLTPTTDAQRHFVKVCRGSAPPVTDHERAYMAYKEQNRKLARAKPTTPASSGPRPRPAAAARPEQQSGNIREYEEGFPNPDWYSGRDRSSLNPYYGSGNR